MSALEWLDGVRADLDAATPGPWRTEWDDADKWHSITGAGHDLGGGLWMVCPEVATVEEGGDADARLIASAPDRLDRMERALRGVLEMHAVEVHWSPASDPSISYDSEADAREHDGCDPPRFEVCSHCGELETRNLEDVGYLDSIYPCPTVTTILEVLR